MRMLKFRWNSSQGTGSQENVSSSDGITLVIVMKIGWLRLWEKADWIICHSNYKHLYHLLFAINQFSEPKGWGINDCEQCSHCPYFEEEGRD